jgi:archaellum component FlaC
VERLKNELQNYTKNLKEISPQIEDLKTKIKVLEGKIIEAGG